MFFTHTGARDRRCITSAKPHQFTDVIITDGPGVVRQTYRNLREAGVPEAVARESLYDMALCSGARFGDHDVWRTS